MNPQELLLSLRSHEFAIEVHLASGLDMVTAIIEQHVFVREIQSRMEADKRIATLVLDSLREIVVMETDLAYESPHDAAIAACLVVLRRSDPSLLYSASEFALSVPNTWWARRIAEANVRGFRDPDTKSCVAEEFTVTGLDVLHEVSVVARVLKAERCVDDRTVTVWPTRHPTPRDFPSVMPKVSSNPTRPEELLFARVGRPTPHPDFPAIAWSASASTVAPSTLSVYTESDTKECGPL